MHCLLNITYTCYDECRKKGKHREPKKAAHNEFQCLHLISQKTILNHHYVSRLPIKARIMIKKQQQKKKTTKKTLHSHFPENVQVIQEILKCLLTCNRFLQTKLAESSILKINTKSLCEAKDEENSAIPVYSAFLLSALSTGRVAFCLSGLTADQLTFENEGDDKGLSQAQEIQYFATKR